MVLLDFVIGSLGDRVLSRIYPAGNAICFLRRGATSVPGLPLDCSTPSLVANSTQKGWTTAFFTPSTDTYGTRKPFFATHILALV
jgi:hypothetical protein